MTWNLWTIVNKPRLTLTMLDEFVVALYVLAFIGVVYWLFVWLILRKNP